MENRQCRPVLRIYDSPVGLILTWSNKFIGPGETAASMVNETIVCRNFQEGGSSCNGEAIQAPSFLFSFFFFTLYRQIQKSGNEQDFNDPLMSHALSQYFLFKSHFPSFFFIVSFQGTPKRLAKPQAPEDGMMTVAKRAQGTTTTLASRGQDKHFSPAFLELYQCIVPVALLTLYWIIICPRDSG